MNDLEMYRLATRAVHAGTRTPRPDFTPTVTPIHPSVTYLYDQMEDLDRVFAGTRQGYVYSRYGNPTVTALEEIVAVLEGGEAALAFASGMAAVHAALLAVGAKAGSTVIAARSKWMGAWRWKCRRQCSRLRESLPPDTPSRTRSPS